MSQNVKPSDLTDELIEKIDIAVKQHILNVMNDLAMTHDGFTTVEDLSGEISFSEDLGLGSLDMAEITMTLRIHDKDINVDHDKVRDVKTLQDFLVLVYEAYPR